jgi:DNA-binding CsgD family transcriptional regulator
MTPDQIALYRKYWFTLRLDTAEIARRLMVHESIVWNHRASLDRVVVLHAKARA